MQRSQQLAIVGGIAAIGVIGALPFLRQPEVSLAPDIAPDAQVTLARELPPRLELSPAQGLHDDDPQPESAGFVAPTISRSRLESHGLPPDLPERYQPLAAPLGEHHAVAPPVSPASTSQAPPETQPELSLAEPLLRIHAEPAAPSNPPVARPERTHRIVDGDTLPRLAKRYWNDETLADELFAANQGVLSAPDPLPLGAMLRIPAKPVGKVSQPVASETGQESPAPVRQPKLEPPGELPLAPIPSGAFSSPGT